MVKIELTLTVLLEKMVACCDWIEAGFSTYDVFLNL
jgi:hypothetical protein